VGVAYVACEREAKGDPNAQILEGVCTPFLYFGNFLFFVIVDFWASGSAGTIFGIHQEDEDICAWNLQLYGANKVGCFRCTVVVHLVIFCKLPDFVLVVSSYFVD
jgi:hypothetical protein